MHSIVRLLSIICLFCFVASPSVSYGETTPKHERKGEFYFSWGYNKEQYTNSTVYVSQPNLNSEFSLQNITAHDKPGWDNGFFQKALTIPQYNYRIGYFFNKEKGLAVELNFDHTKYIISEGQQAHVVGKVNDQQVNYYVTFSSDHGFYYYLNNGANFFLFNLVKRWEVLTNKSESKKARIDLITKAGVGPVIPHVQNSFFGNANTPHFQLGGWNTGVEAGAKITFYKTVYIEYTNKLDYARYSGLKIYDGTARQSFGTYEMILSMGLTFPAGKVIAEKDKEQKP